jgi:uncharacterized glyoxalase superfamily protein PhnB
MQIKKLTPNFMVDDVRETIKFYTRHLGFELRMAVPADKSGVLSKLPNDGTEVIYANLAHGDLEISFQIRDSFEEDVPVMKGMKIGASTTFYFEVDDVEVCYERLKDTVEVLAGPKDAWYGMRELYIKDNNGYILTLGQTLQQ